MKASLPTSPKLAYHIERNISLCDSIYRYASSAWCELICEARKLYELGDVELDEDELALIESDAGIKAMFEGREIILDTPDKNWGASGYVVYVLNDQGNVIRLEIP